MNLWFRFAWFGYFATLRFAQYDGVLLFCYFERVKRAKNPKHEAFEV